MRFRPVWLACWLPLCASGAGLYPVLDGGHCGYSDSSGRAVIPQQFQNCGEFSEGLAPVQNDDRWGYVDENGKLVIAPQFLAADSFSEGLAFVTVNAQSKAVIDRKGQILFSADYHGHSKFSDGLARVQVVTKWICPGDDSAPREQCPGGGGWPSLPQFGYIDTSGAMAIPPHFYVASDFHEGLAEADRGFIDHSGALAIPGPFLEVGSFSEGVAAIENFDEGWRYIDKRGTPLTQPVFDVANQIQGGRGLVKLNGLFGYVDTSGSQVISPQYENALSFSEGKAAVEKNGKWGYIDPSGAIAIPLGFDAAQSFRDGTATVILDSQTLVIDPRGTPIKSRLPSLAESFQRLQGFEKKPDSEGPLAQIIPILSVYKDQLRQLATDHLMRSNNPASLQSSIEAALRTAGVRLSKDQDQDPRPYGTVAVEVVLPPQQPDLVAVLFHLNLADAVDTSLSVFRRSGVNWDLVFKLDRNDYFKWALDAYYIDPPEFTAPDERGDFLMLLASDSGRSVDGGYGLWVDLYRVDRAFHTDQLLHREYSAKDHQIALDPDGFRLETISLEHDAARAGYRVFPYRYRVESDQVVRIAPIGFDAHDFIGEWGNLPWEEAEKWVDPAHVNEIQQFYNSIRTPEGYFGGEFGVPQVCDPQQRIWQIGFGADPITGDHAIYFLIERKDQWTFIVRSISMDQQPGCKDVELNPGAPFATTFAKPLVW